MQPSDIGPQYKSKLRESANFAVWSIKKAIKDNGARIAGSDAEMRTEEFFISQTGSAADKTDTNEFPVRIKIDTLRYRINFILLLLSTACSLAGVPVAAVCLAFIAYLFLIIKPFSGLFCKKAISHNTLLTRSGSSDLKKRIIFEGNADSGFEWRLKAVTMFEFLELAGILWLIAFSVFQIITVGINGTLGHLPLWYSWASLAFIPAYAILFIAVNYKITPDGANNNLSGAFSAAAVLKFMSDNDIRFEHTEVCALITGGSEQNRAGASYFAKEYKSDGIDTLFISLDTLRDYESLALTTNSDKARQILTKAAENAGVTFDSSVKINGVSSFVLAKKGIDSAAVTAMNPAESSYYRTREDTVENINIKTIEKTIEIAVEAVCIFDGE